jgi:hypothetical protein
MSGTDNCGSCTVKGDIKACEAAPCSMHDNNWYVLQLRAENANLRAVVAGQTAFHSDEAVNAEVARMRDKRDEFRNMLEDVVNVLDLSEGMIETHGPLGTAPAELVRLVLERKDREISMLKAGFKALTGREG